MSEKKLNRAVELLNKGKLEEAYKLLKKLVESQKNQFEPRFLLGTVAMQLGELQEAESHLKQAIGLQPSHANAHFQLGNLLYNLGRPQEALASYSRAAELDNSSADYLNGLGNALNALGDHAKALQCFELALKLNADFYPAYANIGNVLNAAGHYERAIPYLARALELAPDSAASYLNLGNSLCHLGRQREAMQCYQKFIELEPERAEGYSSLGNLLRETYHYDEAIGYLKRAISLNPSLIEAHHNLAGTYTQLGFLESAEEAFRQALKINPDYRLSREGLLAAYTRAGEFDKATETVDSLLERYGNEPGLLARKADIAERRGDKEGAYAQIKESFRDHPDDPETASLMVRLCNHAGRCDEAIPALERVLDSDQGLSRDNRLDYHFVLGKALDEAKQYDRAFTHYHRGNELKGMRLERDKFSAHIRTLIDTFSRDFLARAQCSNNDARAPIFVFGMPRSGSTLVEQIIASHPQAETAGERKEISQLSVEVPALCDSDKPYPEAIRECPGERLDVLAGKYLQKMQELTGGGERIIDKMPHNFLHLGLMYLLFPNATFIHTTRNKVDTCLSCYFQNFEGLHDYAYHLGDLGFYYRQYETLMEHWRQALPRHHPRGQL